MAYNYKIIGSWDFIFFNKSFRLKKNKENKNNCRCKITLNKEKRG